MSKPVEMIPLARLALTFLPVAVVLGVLYRWSLGAGTSLYAMGRMLLQLLLIGYVLTFIFTTSQPAVVLVVLSAMLLIASWIALRPLADERGSQYWKALGSIALGGCADAGVGDSTSARDRALVQSEQSDSAGWDDLRPVDDGDQFGSRTVLRRVAARRDVRRSSGHRTEGCTDPDYQFLVCRWTGFAAGNDDWPDPRRRDPLVAARYQIMVMAMLFGSAGISAACYLTLVKPTEASP